jgi:hypothetical protein
MRTPTHHSYEIYLHPTLDEEMLVIPAEQFSFLAFLFHGLWLIFKGAWRIGLLFLAVFGMISVLLSTLGAPEIVLVMTQLALQLWCGFEAQHLRSLDARLRGFTLAQIVVATSTSEAEYFALQDSRESSAA